jgi:hypothetical protein
MTDPDVLKRLASVRPRIADQTLEVFDNTERAELLASMLSSSAIDPAKSKRPFTPRHRTTGAVVGVAAAACATVVALLVIPTNPPNAAATTLAKAVAVFSNTDEGVIYTQQVLHEVKNGTIQKTDIWQDPANAHHFRAVSNLPHGVMAEFGEFVQNGRVMGVNVEFDEGTVFISPALESQPQLAPDDLKVSLEAEERAGTVAILGRQAVDGVPTIHLIGHTKLGQESFWINPTDYHVVRYQIEFHGFIAAGNVQWLPPTPGNLALVNVTPPPGFKVVVQNRPPPDSSSKLG